MNPWIPHLLRAGGGGGGAVLPPAGRTMLANLASSLILDEGAGDPTWSRATKAWGFNELGYLEEIASGCAFFGGARLVRNTVRTTSEDFSNAAWTKSNTTVTGANTIVCANSTSKQSINQIATAAAVLTGQRIMYGFRVKRVVGGVDFIQITGNSAAYGSGQYANFSLIDGSYSATGCTAKITLVGVDTYDINVSVVATNSGNAEACNILLINNMAEGREPLFIGDGVKSFELLRAWSVDVTGYDLTYIPEYVSVGVEASPYFGAGIDGAKYFETDWQGAPIAAANLLRVRREAAAINNLLYSRDMTVQSISMSAKRWEITGTSGAELVTNGTFAADLANWTPSIGSGGSISATGGICTFVSDGGTYTGITNSATITAGKTYVCTVICTGTGSMKFQSTLEVTGISSGTNTFNFVANGTAIILARTVGVACNLAIDSISIKEAAVQCTRATGLDGIANTASTLTFTAADAIILQSITLVSAARCASAYVKRKTGTGTISFTQDGTNWTDITAQINSSTWSRVEITSTLANPSVGFKGGTLGDAIDVDCVQNEAGAVATSPIVTTTAAITRNADSLTYQTAGNIDFAVGTLYGEIKTPVGSATRTFVSVGDSTTSVNNIQTTQWRVNDGTTVVTKSGLSDITTAKRKRAVSWGGAGLSVTGDGLAPETGAFDGAFGSGATITIGTALNGYVGPVAIYNYQMTDAELQAITA